MNENITNNNYHIWFKGLESYTEKELKDLEKRIAVGFVPACDMFDVNTPMETHVEGIKDLIAKMNSNET